MTTFVENSTFPIVKKTQKRVMRPTVVQMSKQFTAPGPATATEGTSLVPSGASRAVNSAPIKSSESHTSYQVNAIAACRSYGVSLTIAATEMDKDKTEYERVVKLRQQQQLQHQQQYQQQQQQHQQQLQKEYFESLSQQQQYEVLLQQRFNKQGYHQEQKQLQNRSTQLQQQESQRLQQLPGYWNPMTASAHPHSNHSTHMQGPGPMSNHSSRSGNSNSLNSSRSNEIQRNYNSHDFSDHSDAPSDNGMYTQENIRESSLALDGGPGPVGYEPDSLDGIGAVGQMQGTGQCGTVSNGGYLGSSASAGNRDRDREHSSNISMGLKSPIGADNHRSDVSHALKGSPTHLIDHIQQALSDRGSPLHKFKDSSSCSSSEKKRKREKLLYVNLAKNAHFLDRSMKKIRENQEVNGDTLSKAREGYSVDAKELLLPSSTSSSSSSSSSSRFQQYRTHGMSPHANIADSDSISGPFQPKPSCRNAGNGSESHPDNGIAELLLSMAVAHPMPCPSPALFLPSTVMPLYSSYSADPELSLPRTMTSHGHGRQIRSQQFASQQHPPSNESSSYHVKHAVIQQEGSSPSDAYLNPL